MTIAINKCRDRQAPTFANINLLGRCNANCYFCLGKDISEELKPHNQLTTHYTNWQNFKPFLASCKQAGINKLFITGQTADGLQYTHLEKLLIYLQDYCGFEVGVRTNGYLANSEIISKFNGEIGYSIHSLIPQVNATIMGKSYIPNWDYLLNNSGNNVRVSIVLNRYNIGELINLFQYISEFPKVKYIQVRRVSTEKRLDDLQLDIDLYETFFNWFQTKFEMTHKFYNAEIFNPYGKDIAFWRTVETTCNSWNYFTDGTYSTEYFIVEGYLKEMQRQATEVVVNA